MNTFLRSTTVTATWSPLPATCCDLLIIKNWWFAWQLYHIVSVPWNEKDWKLLHYLNGQPNSSKERKAWKWFSLQMPLTTLLECGFAPLTLFKLVSAIGLYLLKYILLIDSCWFLSLLKTFSCLTTAFSLEEFLFVLNNRHIGSLLRIVFWQDKAEYKFIKQQRWLTASSGFLCPNWGSGTSLTIK